MTDRRNFLAGVTSSVWTAALGLLVMPWYLQYLGVEAFGVIGVYLTLQGFFAFLDMGFAPAVSREVARARANDTPNHARKVVHSMAIIFVAIASAGAAVLALASPVLATKWLNPETLSTNEVTAALALCALAIGARFPGTLYIGVLTGARRIDLASGVTIGSTTFGNLGAVGILAFVSPSLEAFFLWQLLIGASHSIAMRAIAWYVLGGRQGARFDWSTLTTVWSFTAGMALIAGMGSVMAHADKAVLAVRAPLEEVGHYTIAVTVAGILYRIALPAYNVLYPKLTELFEVQDISGVADVLRHDTRMALTLIFPVAAGMTLCAEPVLAIWLRDPQIVKQAAPLIKLLAIGTALHCVMYFPFAAQVASGKTRIPIFLSLGLIAIFLPLLFVLTAREQAQGAALAWVILHSIYFVVGTIVTDRFLLRGEGWYWVLHSVAPPFMTSVTFGAAAAGLISLSNSYVAQFAIGSFFAAAALVGGVLTLPEGRSVFCHLVSGARRMGK